MDTSKEKICHILQFFFDKGENASQAAENVNSVYGPDTVTANKIDRLKEAIVQKRPALVNRRGIVFHQDNARPHTSIVTRQKLRELDWEVLMYPPYSPDLTSSDYHLFLSMANDFAGEKFALREACENRLSQFFANRDEGFYERGIMELPSKWQQVIELNDAYLT
ncbi:SETMR methyltransferase, partial [Acromyrmex insinuator]